MTLSRRPHARRSVRPMPCRGVAIVAIVVALLAQLANAVPVTAANDASAVVVDVIDATTMKPIGLVRVIVQGETGTIGYTDADGRARFESVATGSYRAMVVKRGYVTARSPLFDVTANRTSTIRVALQRSGSGLKQIGGISVTTSPARGSRDVGQDDALRYLDGSLRDAIGDLPGVTSSIGGYGIDGNDASQTGTSVDGVAIPGIGGSLSDRGINADLFGGASVSSGAANGALGGTVNFRTLQPTRYPQAQTTLQYGSDNASSALFVARGSVRNLGYVIEHTVRGRTSPFSGLAFTDATGLRYQHDGERLLTGDLAKLRWAPSIAQTLTLTATNTASAEGLVCTQFIALYPCGFGPGAFARTRSSLVTLSEAATIGAVAFALSGFTNISHNTSDERNRAIGGLPAPQSDIVASRSRGVNLSVQLPAGERHDISFAAQTYRLMLDATMNTALGTFPLAQRSSYQSASFIDRYHLNPRVTVTARAGESESNGAGGTSGGLDLRWQPNRNTAFILTGSAGDAGAGLAVSGIALPDPRSLTFDCANGLAYGNVPSVNAAHQTSSSLRASAERSGKRGRVALTAWTTRFTGAPVFAAIDALAAGLPSGYFAGVGAIGASPFVCGSQPIGSLAFTSYQPGDQISRGATISGAIETGKALIAGFMTVQSRFVVNATPATAALTPVGAQVPGTPLHRAGILATAKIGKAVDVLGNLSYTAANNPNRLPAYTTLNAGFAMPLPVGSLTIVGTNLTNAHPGPFVAANETLPLARNGAAPLTLAATPLAQRALALTYTVRLGRVGASGSGAGTTDASSADEREQNGVAIRINATPLRVGPHLDALQIDPDNDACTPVAARLAQPVMDAMGRIAAGAERAKSQGRYPATIRDGRITAGGVTLAYQPYDDDSRYVVTAAAPLNLTAAFINCARLSTAHPEDREKSHIYLPEQASKGLFIAYAPLFGIYIAVPEQLQRGAVQARATLDPEPLTAPVDPFAQRPAPACPAASRPVADAVVSAMRAALDAQAAGSPALESDAAVITGRGTAPDAWFEIAPRDPIATVALIQCLHVAGVPQDRLTRAHIDDTRRPGAFGFTARFGFYQIARPQPPATSTTPVTP